MGFWQRLFGAASATIEHSELGRLTKVASDRWEAETVEPIGCKGRPSLSIRGDDNGPDPVCAAAYRRLRESWDAIRPGLAQEIFELNGNYFSDSPSAALQSPDDVWEAAELIGIDVSGDGDFELTYRFDWQAPDDGHEITFYFEKWEPVGQSIDG